MAKSEAGSETSFVLLDGMRGVGAIIVVMGHSMSFWPGVQLPTGTVLVDIFFLLSGFVIAYAFEPRLSAGMTAGSFMIGRLIRFYPLYILGTLIAFPVVLIAWLDNGDGGSAVAFSQLLPQLAMIPSPPQLQTPDIYSFNNPAWTLFFEVVVNLAYVLAFRWLRDVRILGLVVLAWAIALAAANFTWPGGNPGSHWNTALGGLARAGFGFFCGVLIFRLVGSPRTANRPRSWAALLLLAVVPLYALVPTTTATQAVTEFVLVAVLGIPLILAGQSIQPPAALRPLCLFLGRVSYGMYILHYGFVLAATRLEWRFPLPVEFKPLVGVALILISILFAYVAERFYDQPVRRVITGVMKRHRAKAKSAAKSHAE